MLVAARLQQKFFRHPCSGSIAAVLRLVPRISPVRHFAAACSPLLLERHFPDQLAMDRTAPPQHYLGQLADLVFEARTVSTNGSVNTAVRSPRRRANQLGELRCSGCGQHLPPHQFSTKRSLCKTCDASKVRAYHRTLRGNVNLLVNTARTRSRRKGWSCSMQMEHVLEMLLQQEGRCYYSGVPLEILFPNSNWRMSLERLDNSRTYCQQNCVLVAAEFNSSDHTGKPGVKKKYVQGSSQWSAEKVVSIRESSSSVVHLEMLNQDVTVAHQKGYQKCSSPFQYYRTLRGKSKMMAASARMRSRIRGQPCELNYTDILQMLLEQHGRCFYSGVPLQYHYPHADWMMSLERLDNNVGYVEGNCVLIAAEFNTADHSRHAVGEVRGSSQWSLAKVMHVWGRAGFL